MNPKKKKKTEGKNNDNLQKNTNFFLRITFFYQSKCFCHYYRKK